MRRGTAAIGASSATYTSRRTGKYIVYHDDRTNRQCDRDLALEESTEAEIRSLRVRESGKDTFTDSLKLPYLSEYIDVCARYGKTAVVELKNPMAPEHIANIVRICEEGYDLSDVVFISFCFENLVESAENQTAARQCSFCAASTPMTFFPG